MRVLDARARTVMDEIAIAAAEALAGLTGKLGLCNERMLPGMGEMKVAARLAAATGAKAQAQGAARKRAGPDKLYREALATMRDPREATRLFVDARIIPPRP